MRPFFLFLLDRFDGPPLAGGGGKPASPLAVLDRPWSPSWAHPAVERTLVSKNRHSSGQAKGFSSAAPSRQRCSRSPPGVLRRT